MSDLLRIDGYFAPVKETDWEELNKAFAKWYTRKGYKFYGIIWPTTEERMRGENDGPSILLTEDDKRVLAVIFDMAQRFMGEEHPSSEHEYLWDDEGMEQSAELLLTRLKGGA